MRMALVVFVFGLASFGAAQSPQPLPPQDRKLSDTLTHLESADLETREVAFDELKAQMGSDLQSGDTSEVLDDFLAKHPDQADRVKVALIRLLNHQNELPTRNYPEVIDAVASLNDERAIPALAGAIDTGQMAILGLMKYGDKALGPVLEQLKNPSGTIRGRALSVSVALLATRNDAASRARMRSLVETYLKDSDPIVRGNATRRIACLDDRLGFMPLLQELSKSDPFKLTWEGGDVTYPVRSAANEVLQGIRDKKPCNPGGAR